MSDLVENTYDRVSCHTVHLLMHQTLCNPLGLGNSGDIIFSLSKGRVYAQYCGDTLMTKALAKALLIYIFPWPFLAWNQIPATPWHYHDSAEVNTLCTVKPGFALTIHSPRGTGFLMTYLDLLVLGLALFYISWSNCKLMNPEYRCVLLPEWAELPQWTTGMDLNLCLWVLFMYFN